MNHYILEGHRPNATWERQTRCVEAATLGEACISAEKSGIVITTARGMPSDFNLAGLQRANIILFTPWETRETPVK